MNILTNRVFLAPIALIVIAVILPLTALGATLKAGEEIFIDSTAEGDENLYVAGGNVTVKTDVAGDLLTAGGNVLISGNITKDLTVAGGSVTILGSTGDDVRVAGGNILIAGNIEGELVVVGGSITIASGTTIKKDLVIAGGQVIADGDVEGDVTITGGIATIGGHVRGDVNARVEEKLTLSNSAIIDGDLTYAAKSAEVLNKKDGAVVNGDTVADIVEPVIDKDEAEGFIAGLIGIFVFIKFLTHLVVALILVWLFRNFSNSVVNEATQNTLTMLGKGFVALVVVPIAAVLLLVTVFGAPLGLMAILAYGLLILIASMYSAVVAGAWLGKVIHGSGQVTITWSNVVLGVLLLTILGFIPVVGWIIGLLIFLFTFGSVVDLTQKKLWQGR